MVKKIKMGRPKGIDIHKLEIIIDILDDHPEGLWINMIANYIQLHPSTISKYIHLNSMYFDITPIESHNGKKIIELVKLKPNAKSRAAKVLRQIFHS